jgi:hypothetical protein
VNIYGAERGQASCLRSKSSIGPVANRTKFPPCLLVRGVRSRDLERAEDLHWDKPPDSGMPYAIVTLGTGEGQKKTERSVAIPVNSG